MPDFSTWESIVAVVASALTIGAAVAVIGAALRPGHE